MRFRAPIQSLDLEVDLRMVQPDRRSEEVLTMFGALGRGEGFVVVDDQPPAHLLRVLQDRFIGDFDWYPLVTDPGRWRVLLARRRTRMSPLRRVVDFMTSDHRRMEQMLIRVRELAEMGEWRRVGGLVGYLRTGARRHIRIEERFLFPVLFSTGRSRGTVGLEELQREHRQLLDGLTHLHEVCEEPGDDPRVAPDREVARLSGSLLRGFFRHEAKEDRLLYAQTDLLLNSDETDALVRRCQAI